MKKVYESHELAYQNLKRKGAKSWHEMYSTEAGKEPDHIGHDRKSFFEDILTKDWAPKNGNALEIGSGTGHFIRWIVSKGFVGSGIEISETALDIAKEQSKDLNIDYYKDDYCYSNIFPENKFDLIVDGSCFHCIVEHKDRKAFLAKSRSLLKKDGLFILYTSCSPIDEKQFSENYKTQKYEDEVFYVPFETELEGSKIFDGKMYMSQRRFEHWEKILKSLDDSGFEPQLFRYEKDKVFSRIYVAAKLK